MADPLNSLATPLRPPRELRLRQYVWLGLLFAGPIPLLLLRLFPALDQSMFHNGLGQVLIAGESSLLGVALALLVLRVAYRSKDGRIFLIGMGFLSTASLFFLHYRLATANLSEAWLVVAMEWSALLSLVAGSVFFGLSGLDLRAEANGRLMRFAGPALIAYLVLWIAAGWIFFVLLPWLTARMPIPGPTALNPMRAVLLLFGLGCYAFAAARHYALYRRSPSTAGLAIICGILLFAESLLTQHLARPYAPSFWLYHAQEAAGFGVISYAALIAARRGQTDEGLLESLFFAATRVRLHAECTRAMDLLVESLSRAEPPSPVLRDMLQSRFGLTESQLQVFDRAAATVTLERRRRQEIEQFYAALRRFKQDKDDLMQMAVHDMKNPLAAQLGFLQILQMSQLTEDQQQLLEGALRSTQNLSGLIGDLLDIARIEEGRLELERSLFAAHSLLHDCAEEMRGWIAQSGKSITVEAAADLPLLHADPRLIRRIILNLIANAIKHTPAGTHITLRAYAAGEGHAQVESIPDEVTCWVIIEVADDGAGIPSEYLERIFEKFERGLSGRTNPHAGTGLGLTFCRLAMEAHGGSIGVTSTLDSGTTFRLTLAGV